MHIANTFNVVNRKAFLHNINIICPSIAKFVQNYYARPSRLFVIASVEIADDLTGAGCIPGLKYWWDQL